MFTESKILTLPQAIAQCKHWREEGLEVVFTNGCFDMVHLGHIDYLEKARNLGNRLVLGLNTDASVSRIKGPLRPVVNQYARSRMMAALAFIDLVVLFDEPTPLQLIEALNPNILVKGNDYAVENIVGAGFVVANGGNIQTIPLVEGYSTTKLIQKIKESF